MQIIPARPLDSTALMLLVSMAASLAGCGSDSTGQEFTALSSNLTQSATPWRMLTKQAREEWRAGMSKVQVPGHGCFHGAYPKKVWESTPCVAVSSPDPMVGGGDPEYTASTSGIIPMAEGFFDYVSGLTCEGDLAHASNCQPGQPGYNQYSLQLNTNKFGTPACDNSPSNCRGWQQFVYKQTDHAALLEIWHILINWGPFGTCPDGYHWDGHACYKASPSPQGIPSQPLSNLANLSLVAKTPVVTGGTDDTALFSDGTGNVWVVTEDAAELDLTEHWSSAEYNIYGYGGGGMAVFNAGTTIGVHLLLIDWPNAAPMPINQTHTAETNSLTVQTASACAKGFPDGPSKGMQFVESSAEQVPPPPFCLANNIASLQLALQ